MDRIEVCARNICNSLYSILKKRGKVGGKRLGHFANKGPRNREVPMGVASLVLHGLSSVLATGVFVVTVHVAHEIPGPSMISALVIAAVSCFLSGLCYAELEAKTKPRTEAEEPEVGPELMHRILAKFSGELPAFVSSWVLVLHHLATLTASARVIGSALVFVAGGPNPSSCSVEIVAVVAVVLVVTVGGASGSASDARSFAACALAILATVTFLLVGFPSIDARNWAAHSYLTHGSSGLLSGAAVCTSAFFGHPAVAVHGRRCRRSIPLATGLTLTVCFLAYLSVATILTLTTVREERGTELHMPQAAREDTRWTHSLLAILQVPCLGVSLLGTVQFLKACATSLVIDRLFCRRVGSRNFPRWVVPFAAGTLTSGLVFVSGTPTMLRLMAMSPLLSNTLVCLCVLRARYQPSKDFAEEEEVVVDGHAYRPLLPVKPKSGGQKPLITINRRRLFPLVSSESLEKRKSRVGGCDEAPEEEEEDLMGDEYGESDEDDVEDEDEDEDDYDEDTDDTDIDAVFAEYVQKLKVATSGEFLPETSTTASRQPTPASGRRATYCVVAFFGVSSCITVLLVAGQPGTSTAVPVAVLTTVALSLLAVMARIPQSRSREQDAVDGPFRVPLVPWQPAIAVFVSTCLAVDTVRVCWLPFGVWAAVGAVVYACCAQGRDRGARRPRGERICLPLLNPPPHQLVASLIPVHRDTMDSMVIKH